MRVLVVGCVAALVALGPGQTLAQDAETLKRELEQLRRQFETIQQEYQKSMQGLSERIQRLEAQPQPTAVAPVAPGSRPSPIGAPVAQAPPGQAPPSAPGLLDYARPRPPFSLAERTGRGQLLFDIGVAGDFVANITQDNVDKANAGTFSGRENRIFPREIELSLFGQIDPYARGEVRIEAAEEFEDGVRDTHVGLAEAHLTLLTLPFGTQLKLGLMRARFGLLNERHQHDLPQTDRPNVLVRFLGEEQLVEPGVELSWIPPLPFYLETLVGAFNGDNEDAFGRGSLKEPLLTGRLRTFFDFEELGAIQLGVSGATGRTAERRRQTFGGVDAKYKLTPEGWRHPLLTLAGEALFSNRRVVVTGDPDEDGIETEERRTRRRFGWYTYAEVQPWRPWAFGVRYDSTQFLEASGREWAIQPYVTFRPSEFLFFRLGYKHTERDRREPFSANDATARTADEVFLQAGFILGAHPTHPF